MAIKGKAFGALKAAVIRMLHKGYRPEWTQIAVTVADRERLRSFCIQNKCRSMVEGFNKLLDQANVQAVDSVACKNGKLAGLVSSLRIKSDEYDGNILAERVRKGEFDDFISEYKV